jgi:hypothetical protein
MKNFDLCRRLKEQQKADLVAKARNMPQQVVQPALLSVVQTTKI